jgi:hypothetical protein
VDSDVCKAFREFRQGEVARNYRSATGPHGMPSILNQTIDDLIQIHDFIDTRRRESAEQIKRIVDQARDKQVSCLVSPCDPCESSLSLSVCVCSSAPFGRASRTYVTTTTKRNVVWKRLTAI